MNQQILVTGGSGLLGSYLLRALISKGYTNLTATYQQNEKVIPPDLRDRVTWMKLRLPDLQDAYEATVDKDWVIHSAGLVSYLKEDKYRLLNVNQTGTEHLVNASIANEVKHFIYVGSIGALGKEKNNITLDENTGWVSNHFSTAYGHSKYLGELEVWRGVAEGLQASVVLPSVILGAGDWKRSSLQMIDRIATASPWYPGGQTGFVDVRDVARFIIHLLERSMTGERWVVSGKDVRYADLYDMVANALGMKRKYRLAPKWLARAKLFGSHLSSGKMSVPDILNQVYGTFSYDAKKSLNVEGFIYTPFEKTIADVARAYRREGAFED